MATLNIKNLPDPLYEALKARAESQHRSIAQEATHILSEALGTPQPLSILELQGLGKELWSGIDAARHVAEERDSWTSRASRTTPGSGVPLEVGGQKQARKRNRNKK